MQSYAQLYQCLNNALCAGQTAIAAGGAAVGGVGTFIDDPKGTTAGVLFNAANAVGSASSNLRSSDHGVQGRQAAGVFLGVFELGLGARGLGAAKGGAIAASGIGRGTAAVRNTARAAASQGTQHLGTFLSLPERLAAARSPGTSGMFYGQAVHRATDAALDAAYPGRFTYSTRGPDFLDTVTNRYVELTTPGQLASHQARYGSVWNGISVDYVTYQLP